MILNVERNAADLIFGNTAMTLHHVSQEVLCLKHEMLTNPFGDLSQPNLLLGSGIVSVILYHCLHHVTARKGYKYHATTKKCAKIHVSIVASRQTMKKRRQFLSNVLYCLILGAVGRNYANRQLKKGAGKFALLSPLAFSHQVH